MYGLQHGALAHTEQQAIKGPKITSVKPFKQENQRSNLYKKKKKIPIFVLVPAKARLWMLYFLTVLKTH